MGENFIFSSLCQSVNKHLLQKTYGFSNKPKSGYHLRIKCSDCLSVHILYFYKYIYSFMSWSGCPLLPTSSLLFASPGVLGTVLFSRITNYSSSGRSRPSASVTMAQVRVVFLHLQPELKTPRLSQALCRLTGPRLLSVPRIHHFYYSVTHLIQFFTLLSTAVFEQKR